MIDYHGFTNALSSGSPQPEASFSALADLAGRAIGVKLFTLMTFDQNSNQARRIYSNMPEAYPVMGTKSVDVTEWTQHVLINRHTFVANDIDRISQVFGDFELIRSLGCGSVVNVPVLASGIVLGTINCLHETGYYSKAKVAASEALKLPGAACFLLNFAISSGEKLDG